MSARGQQPRLLLSVFSTFKVGGPQVRFAAIANHFGARYRHAIVAMDGDFAAKEKLSPSLDVSFPVVDNRKGETIANRRRFRQELRAIKPDRLVTYNWGAIEWAMANWPHLVAHLHIEDGFGPEEAQRQLWRRSLTRRLALCGSTVAVPSRLLEHIALDVWKLRRSSLHYIPNGIDCARFAKPGIEPLVARDVSPVIGTVAALRQEKNLARMLEAFRLIRNEMACRLVIAGDGTERPRLEMRAAELGLASDVIFTGYREDTERVYAGLDVFMLSSDTEQMPTTVLEAMAAGLPVVATDVGDVAEMLAAPNRPFVVPATAQALARAALSLLNHKELRHQVGAANQARARSEFAQERMFAAYCELFDRAT
jgi:glycosyltransferase involved in cell wall biosynthesis